MNGSIIYQHIFYKMSRVKITYLLNNYILPMKRLIYYDL